MKVTSRKMSEIQGNQVLMLPHTTYQEVHPTEFKIMVVCRDIHIQGAA